MKRNLVFLAIALLGVLYAGGKTEEDKKNGVTSLSLWTAWLDPGEEALYKKFNATHKDVQITWELLAFRDYSTKIVASARTDQLPDILRLQPKAPAQYGSLGVLRPLNDVLDKLGGAGTYPESYLKYNTVDGKIYGLPFYSLPHLLFYRKDLLEAAGLEAPKDWQQFEQAARALTSNDRAGYYAFLNDPSVGHLVHQWMGAHGADTFGPNLSLTIESQKTRETLDFLDKMYKEGLMNSDIASSNMDDARLAFLNGRAAMITTSSSFIPQVAKSSLREKVGVLPLPKNGSENNYFAFHSYSISRATKHLDAVITFLNWTSQPENQILYWSEGTRLGDIPANKKLRERYLALDNVSGMADFLKPALAATEHGWMPGLAYGANRYPGLFDSRNIYQNMLLHMILKGETAEQATSWAAEQMREIMER